jgi:hypothetical protein
MFNNRVFLYLTNQKGPKLLETQTDRRRIDHPKFFILHSLGEDGL